MNYEMVRIDAYLLRCCKFSVQCYAKHPPTQVLVYKQINAALHGVYVTSYTIVYRKLKCSDNK